MAKRKVKAKKITKILLAIILIVAILVGGSFYYIYNFSLNKPKNPAEDKKEEVIKKEPKDYSARLFMVGDALIHDCVYTDAKRQGNGSYDFKPMIENIKAISSKYDLAYYNQETILGGTAMGLSHYPRFNSPHEVGDAFLDAGFNLVSLATNHTMDRGETGVINSVNYWKSKKDKAVYSGQWISHDERAYETSQIYEKNGIKYAFFSYTTWTNGLSTPKGKEYLNNVYSDELAYADISKVRDLVDVVIVAMHWGTEYSHGVSAEQTKIANYLSSIGTDIIIGAHPHVVEPVEYINNGKTFVIYSLGNVISAQIGNERLTGLMMEITIKKHVDENDNVTITLENPRAELIYTKYYTNPYCNNFKVYTYPQLNNSILPNYEALYGKFKNIVSSRYPELQWGVTGE